MTAYSLAQPSIAARPRPTVNTVTIGRPAPDLVFVFGPFRLIPSRQLLSRDRCAVALGGRALDILHLLLMRAGAEVSTNALIAFTWPNVFVDRSNLKVHISSLRRTLEDTLPEATYITTIVGRGYQFVGQVQTEFAETVLVDSDHLPDPYRPGLNAAPASNSGTMAATNDVFTIGRVAAMLGESEARLFAFASEMTAADGCITINDVGDAGITGFTSAGIGNLRDLIESHHKLTMVAGHH